jgi:hypothetical protein
VAAPESAPDVQLLRLPEPWEVALYWPAIRAYVARHDAILGYRLINESLIFSGQGFRLDPPVAEKDAPGLKAALALAINEVLTPNLGE